MKTYKFKECPLVRIVTGDSYTCADKLEGENTCPFGKCPETLISDIILDKIDITTPKLIRELTKIIKKAMKGK